MKTNKLYEIAEQDNIQIHNFRLDKTKSTSLEIDGDYYIGLDEKAIETTAEKNTHLAHELGHCKTGAFYNLYSPLSLRGQHEYRADKWAVLNIIPKNEFISLLKKGYERWDLAEHFEVTEDLIEKAFHFYCEMEIIN